MKDKIIIRGARAHNLKNIDIDIPKGKFVVMTGISGSGKSSLAFDTLYQEGQRRYMESLSAYARQFLGNFEKPDVDKIEGLSPSISIDQKTTSNNPRSTVGTVTEIYDYLRLLFARIGKPYCPGSDEPLTKQSIEEMTNKILSLELGSKLMIMAPIVERAKGTHQKLTESLIKDGFQRVYVDGTVYLLEELDMLDKNKFHDYYVVIDRIMLRDDSRSRVYDAFELATSLAKGKAKVLVNDHEMLSFNQNFACIDSDFTIPDLEPRLFSFNTPIGACPHCNGLGIKLEVSPKLVLNDEKTLYDGGIIPYKNNDDDSINILMLEEVCRQYHIAMDVPVGSLSKEAKDIILFGSPDKIHYKFKSSSGRTHEKIEYFEGVVNNLQRRYIETTSEWIRTWIETFMKEDTCPSCKGKRLNKEALSVKIDGKHIIDITDLSIQKTHAYFSNLSLNQTEKEISKLVILEILHRLEFLNDVGLGYMTLSRQASTLSGGEAQRIRLATQIGSQLTGVLYVLDEPSIGLHQKDNDRLIASLKKMRDLGNTLVVVEHDHETMLQSDYLIDIGPGAGLHGGQIVSQGSPIEVMNDEKSLTGQYLSGKLKIEIPKTRRKGLGKDILIVGASENNLKDIDIKFPLGVLSVVTGVSGSGKSSLVNEVLMKSLLLKNNRQVDKAPHVKMVDDPQKIDRIIEISQSPIGRTPRSNPATYTGVFDDIRDLFTKTVDAKSRGYQKGRFSFNVKGGRCEACSGDGVKKISMHFLPDVYVKCEVCQGTRYNKETLQIKYRDKNIADVLNMTIEEAHLFFENHTVIHRKLQTMMDVGLDYITLGQSATTLSGGEAQRVKLSSELYKRITDKTLYILDEPTTGLHTHDVKKLVEVFHTIVDQGATMVIIEHNLDVIKNADYIVDLGPEGGDEGGYLIASGTPEAVSQVKNSYTGKYLSQILKV